MNNKRIYEIAREMNTNHKEVLWIAEKLNLDVKNHMSSVTETDEKKIYAYVEEMKSRNEAARKAPARPVETPAPAEKTKKEAPAAPAADRPAARPAAAQNRRPGDSSAPRKDGNKKPAPRNTQGTQGARPAAGAPAAKAKEAPPAGKNRPPRNRDKKPGDDRPVRRDSKDSRDNRNGKRGNDRNFRGKGKRGRQAPAPQPEPNIKKVVIGEDIAIKDLAMKISRTAADLIGKLFRMGVVATINEVVDFDTASLLMDEYGIEVEFKSNKRETVICTADDEAEDLKARPPIITVMGHVDHGKTSLLDAIRSSRVTDTEAGGITQHIGAYQVEHKGSRLTFIDTPGHAAFTSMRARGAQVTDIAILVVAADDGVMPQTIEAINHARAAGVPIIVAVNKMDKEGANPDRIKQQLTEYDLVSEDWGGDTIFCPVSAIKREGIDNLLEMILLVSELQELKANPARLAEGFVIEAELDKGRGPVATLLVKRGTLRVGDVVVSGETMGKVRAMNDERGKRLKSAGPSTPVEVIGFSSVPNAGDIFQCVEEEKYGKDIVEQRCIVKKEETVQKSRKVNLEDLFRDMGADEKKELNLIVKGDVQGSVEALSQSLQNLNTDEVKVNIIHNGVGAITETDVILASASSGIIIGFNVRPDNNAKQAAAREEVDIRTYRIIYEAIDSVRAAMSGLLDPDIREVELGTAEVRSTFKVPKAGTIAGCYVTDGKITNSAKVRIVRNGVVVFEGNTTSLKRFKDDVREVAAGYECGIGFEKFNDLKEGDVIEAYVLEKVARKL